MTGIGKLLSIFIFTVSVAFAALGLLIWQVPVPDWRGKIPVLNEYSISPQPGDKITWVGIHRFTKAQIASDTALPKVLQSCFSDANKKMKEKITVQTQESESAKAALTKLQESIKIDLESVEKRRTLSLKQISDIQVQKEKLSADSAVEVDKAQKLQEEAEKLREDIFRLTQQLDEIKIERRRIADLKVQLKDLIIRTEGLNQRLLERNQQLKGG